MKYLTQKEFYTNNWNKEREELHKKAIDVGISRDDSYSAWFKTITPLQHYLHGTYELAIKVVDGVETIVERKDLGWKEEVVFLPTNKEFYPNYVCEGQTYCKAALWVNTDSNLDLWTIHLSGNDDYSISWDVIGENEAKVIWDSLFEKELLTEEQVNHFYFSN